MTSRLLVSLLLLAVSASAQHEAQVRRLKDLVMVRQGLDAVERSLFAYEPLAHLRVGDEMEQGGAASSVMIVPAPDPSGDAQGSTLMRFFGPTQIRVLAMGDEADALQVQLVTFMEAEAGPRVLVLQLAGDISLSLRETSLELQREPGRLRVRNTGGEPIRLTAPIAMSPGMLENPEPTTRMLVQRGEEVRVPLFTAPLGSEGEQRGQWGPLSVNFEQGVEPVAVGWQLQLAASDVDGGWASLGGVWTRARPGRVLTITDQRGSGQPFRVTTDSPELSESVEMLGDEGETIDPVSDDEPEADAEGEP